MAKGRGIEFWKRAVERMKESTNIGALAKELEVDLRGLYRWRQRLDPEAKARKEQRARGGSEEVEQLKRALAEKVLEVDFFKGALHKIEARRQGRGGSGAKASTTRSES